VLKLNVVCHVEVRAASGVQGPSGCLSWLDRPGLVNVACISLIQSNPCYFTRQRLLRPNIFGLTHCYKVGVKLLK